MTNQERDIIRRELELCYRLKLREYYKDSKSEDYKVSVIRMVQVYTLAVQLCPQDSTLEDYFGWTKQNKREQRHMVQRWIENEEDI